MGYQGSGQGGEESGGYGQGYRIRWRITGGGASVFRTRCPVPIFSGQAAISGALQASVAARGHCVSAWDDSQDPAPA